MSQTCGRTRREAWRVHLALENADLDLLCRPAMPRMIVWVSLGCASASGRVFAPADGYRNMAWFLVSFPALPGANRLENCAAIVPAFATWNLGPESVASKADSCLPFT